MSRLSASTKRLIANLRCPLCNGRTEWADGSSCNKCLPLFLFGRLLIRLGGEVVGERH